MKVDFPLVSVIIPAYNAEAFIGRTLISVLSQTYKNIEVLVVDDGSLDRTAEITESFAEKDRRVILLKQSNSGVAAARNLAIKESKGEYIAPIDADDIWYPQKLEKQVQCMLKADPTVEWHLLKPPEQGKRIGLMGCTLRLWRFTHGRRLHQYQYVKTIHQRKLIYWW